MTDVHYRRARRADADAILAIKRQAIEELEHWQYTPEQVQAWAPEETHTDSFAAAIADDRFVVHVAEDDEQLVGYGALNVRDERIDAVYVHPDHHGRGVATTLVNHLELSARFKGIARLDVVAARNAVPFYESVGYERRGEEVSTIDGVDVTFVRMRKELADGATSTTAESPDLFETDADEPDEGDRWDEFEHWVGADTDLPFDDWLAERDDGEGS